MQDLENKFISSGASDTELGPNLAALALAEAINRARAAQAERDSFSRDTRAVSISRLEGLRKKLQPLYAAIPRDVELFDLGLVPNERPRLFVDVIAYVEMSKDHKTYRFLQETRSGRVTLSESDDPQRIVDRVTDYIAERLVERERALASDAALDRRLPPPSLDASVLPAVARDLPAAASEPVVLAPAEVVPKSPVVLPDAPRAEPVAAVAAPLAAAVAAPATASLFAEKIAAAREAIGAADVQVTELADGIQPKLDEAASSLVDKATETTVTMVEAAETTVSSAVSALSEPARSAVTGVSAHVEKAVGLAGTTLSAAPATVASAASGAASSVAPTIAAATTAAAGMGAAMAARSVSRGPSWLWTVLLMLLAVAAGAWLAYLLLKSAV
ncbi:MAG: hypothetical protein ACRC7G_12005 [Beijerinckiaceae bacterium]